MFIDDGFDKALARAKASLGAATDSEAVRRAVEFMGYVGPLMKDNEFFWRPKGGGTETQIIIL